MLGLSAAGAVVLAGGRSALAFQNGHCPIGLAGQNGGLYQYYCCICINGSCAMPGGGIQSSVLLPVGCDSPACSAMGFPGAPGKGTPPSGQMPAPSKSLPAIGFAAPAAAPGAMASAVGAGTYTYSESLGLVRFEQFWGWKPELNRDPRMPGGSHPGLSRGMDSVPDPYEPKGEGDCTIRLWARVRGKESDTGREVAAQLMIGTRKFDEYGLASWLIAHEISSKNAANYPMAEFVHHRDRVYTVLYSAGGAPPYPFECVMRA